MVFEMNWKLVDLTVHGDERGNLVAIEKGQGIDFDIKRVFYIYSMSKNTTRGSHANRNSKFLLIALNGSAKVSLDDGVNKEIITLNRPTKGLFINNMIWKEMYDFTKGTVVLCLASEVYDKNEYYYNYNEILKGK